MDSLRIVRCLCGTFQSEIDMGDFTKSIALTSSRGAGHSRGEAIITKSGFLLGYNIDIERKVAYEHPYKPSKKSRSQLQSQIDIVFSSKEENKQSLIEYESTTLDENTIKEKFEKWKCIFPNSDISLLCVIITNLSKEKLESEWELHDRSELVELTRITMKNINKSFSENSFAVISLNDNSITDRKSVV